MDIKAEKITPYGEDRAKGQQVEAMFDNIAPAYDFMNRLMTLGVDRSWRRRVVKMATQLPRVPQASQAPQAGGKNAAAPSVAQGCPRSEINSSRQPTPADEMAEGCGPRPQLLDVATGTADLAISLSLASPSAIITGVDLSEGMLAIGHRKVEEKGLSNRISLRQADCLALPFPDSTFDAVTVAFGVRNFEHLDRGYAEMQRVLKPGGRLIVLELSIPTNPLVKPFYRFYTRCIIPLVGRLVSKDSSAYTYLPKSIAAMPQGSKMLALMEEAGLESPTLRPLTFGVASIYSATKPIHNS